ncbi:MAG TPA: tripartite tricarboxylate transporter substrate binding protein [Burkholderiales bacterium]|nr:tripartite tricarboxylate transporter substrate binding protein [Burkholderiales bacterium]
MIRLLASLLLLTAFSAHAQTWPDKPVRLIVPFPPGGGTDILARLLGQKLGEAWGQPIVVENKAGAGGTLGADAAAKSPPDGYTILMVSASYSVNPSLYRLPFDPLKDLVPVSLVASVPFVLVSPPSLPANNVKELVGLASSKPGAMNFASSGNGSAPHLVGELFAMKTNTKLVHVPFKGGAPALNEVLGGRVEVYFSTITQALGSINAGKLKPLAVTSRQRSGAIPQVPTLEESGVRDFDLVDWFAILAPAGTPQPIVTKISEEIGRQVRGADMKARLAKEGFDGIGSTPAQFEARLRHDMDQYARVVKAAGVRIE